MQLASYPAHPANNRSHETLARSTRARVSPAAEMVPPSIRLPKHGRAGSELKSPDFYSKDDKRRQAQVREPRSPAEINRRAGADISP